MHTSYSAAPGHRFIAVTLVTLLVTALVGVVGSAPAAAVEQTSVIDFESGFSAGDTVGSLSVGQGMSGADLGTVSLVGFNPELAGNTAMIYDATCGGQTVPVTDPTFDPLLCSGDDADLYHPGTGNVAIITEDGNASNPDDSFNPATTFTFDFTDWGPGVVTVDRLTVSDIDLDQPGGQASLFDTDGLLLGVFPLPQIGDNTIEVIPINLSAVATMTIGIAGSGAIDDIQISADSPLIDLELTKEVSAAEVLVGETTTFSVSVVNQGPDTATGVTVTDTLPAALTYVSDTAGGAFDPVTGVWTIGTLAVGATAGLDLVVKVDEAGTFINLAEVTTANEPDIDSTPGNGTENDEDDWDDATVTATLPPAIIDLELTKDVAPAAVQVGEQTTFTVTVFNRGPDDATGVVVTDTLPTGLTYVSDDGAGAYDGATGVWTIGDLALDATVQLSFVVTVDAAGTFTNVAEVTAANEEDHDSTPANGIETEDDWDDATVIATVEPPPPIIDLELTKLVNGEDDEVTIDVDDPATFTVTVENKGPDDATGVAVTDAIPAGLSYVSDTAGGAFDAVTGVWTIGDLAVGASVSMDFVVTMDDIGIYRNTAEVTAANEEDSDSTPGNGIDNGEDDWDDATIKAEDIVKASSTIGDYVWYDNDKDQVQDSDEDPVPGVTVRLTNQATNEVLTQVTNADGKYLFAGLDAGTYLVEVLTSTFPSNHGLTTVGSYTVTVLDDESFLDADFGIVAILPVTGMEVESVALIGLTLLSMGAALLGAERWRRRDALVA